MSATNLNIRTDKDVKEQAEQLFAELGLNMTTCKLSSSEISYSFFDRSVFYFEQII